MIELILLYAVVIWHQHWYLAAFVMLINLLVAVARAESNGKFGIVIAGLGIMWLAAYLGVALLRWWLG